MPVSDGSDPILSLSEQLIFIVAQLTTDLHEQRRAGVQNGIPTKSVNIPYCQ
jgi:hypothetical protein